MAHATRAQLSSSWEQFFWQPFATSAQSGKAAMTFSFVTWERPNERTPGVSMTHPPPAISNAIALDEV